MRRVKWTKHLQNLHAFYATCKANSHVQACRLCRRWHSMPGLRHTLLPVQLILRHFGTRTIHKTNFLLGTRDKARLWWMCTVYPAGPWQCTETGIITCRPTGRAEGGWHMLLPVQQTQAFARAKLTTSTSNAIAYAYIQNVSATKLRK